ncbi:hypothetical protein RhiirA4_489558 [Rhizophagus irregularis]|uniref:Uncharacterized protein n=1 Tax=Rhizophagus irregularis TaxID=588596 RepID=A0A2I1HUW5_9GLOM|nr:hypothetical protein RhiirA4_489558 [Rhizophagus irregularis]
MTYTGTDQSRNAEEFHRTAIACLSEDENFELKKKIGSTFVFNVDFENRNSLKNSVEQSITVTMGSFKLISKYENCKLENMPIILIIDGIFLIPLYTTMITDLVDSILRITHCKHVYLPVASLDPPTIIKDNIVTSIFQTDDHIIKILVNNCKGYRRALEVLQEILKGHDI